MIYLKITYRYIFGKTIRIIDNIFHNFYDFYYKIDLHGIVYTTDSKTIYQPSRSYELNSLLKQIETNGKVFLDIGSGKGMAVYIACRFKFKKIHGVEISKSLYEISIKNFKNKYDNVLLHNCSFFDLSSDIIQTIDIFYLFNSFDEIENLIELFQNYAKPGSILIYNNPVHHYDLVKSKTFSIISRHKFFVSNSPIYLYKVESVNAALKPRIFAEYLPR